MIEIVASTPSSSSRNCWRSFTRRSATIDLK